MSKRRAGPVRFGMVPTRVACDKRLSRGDLCVLLAVCGALRKGTTVAFIGLEKIVTRTELSKMQVTRSLKRLEGGPIRVSKDTIVDFEPYIRRTQRKSRRSGRQLVTAYEVLYEAEHVNLDVDIPAIREPNGRQPSRRIFSESHLGVARPCNTDDPPPSETVSHPDVTDSDLKELSNLKGSSDLSPSCNALRRHNTPGLHLDCQHGESEQVSSLARPQGEASSRYDQRPGLQGITGGIGTAAERKAAERRIWKRVGEASTAEERERRVCDLMEGDRLEREIDRELVRRSGRDAVG